MGLPRGKWATGRVGAGAVIGTLALVLLSLSSAAAQSHVNVAEITTAPSKGGGQLSSGGSATTFHFKLPAGAACTRDSAEGNYRVQSYMVPASEDPASLTFGSQGPLVPGGRPLYDTQTSAYVSALTARAEPADGPGLIVNIPLFNYAVFTPGDIAAGSYNVGIACTLFKRVDRFWNARVMVIADSADKPAGFTWALAGGQPGPDSRPPFAALGVGVGAVASAAGLVLLRRRRGHRFLQSSATQPKPAKEHR